VGVAGQIRGAVVVIVVVAVVVIVAVVVVAVVVVVVVVVVGRSEGRSDRKPRRITKCRNCLEYMCM
jgi:flagellar basal body-associated protein FliL